MNIIEMLAPENTKCRPVLPLQPSYITIHNTSNTNTNASAIAHGKYLQGGGKDKSVSWHYAVDDTNAVLCIPENEVAWCQGDGRNGTGNRHSLSIEICENPESDLQTATNNAAELTASLMHKYGIGIDKVVQHNSWTGKDCPRRIRAGEPYNWGTFIDTVNNYYNGSAEPTVPTYVPIAEADEHIDYQVCTGKNWWGWVRDCNENDNGDSNGFAGVENKLITAIRAKATVGRLHYRVHTINGKWWDWIEDFNTTDSNGYAGVIGKNIDMLKMDLVDAPGYQVEYRVSTNNSTGYLDWVHGFNDTDGNGYAGITGTAIDKLQCRIVRC